MDLSRSGQPVLSPFLQSISPCKDTLDARRVWRDDADGSETRASSRDILVHRVEPVIRHLPRPRSHVSEDDRSAEFEMIYERIKTRGSMMFTLATDSLKKCLKTRELCSRYLGRAM